MRSLVYISTSNLMPCPAEDTGGAVSLQRVNLKLFREVVEHARFMTLNSLFPRVIVLPNLAEAIK